jgi:myo-inositol-1(or 4)-monophosphatase
MAGSLIVMEAGGTVTDYDGSTDFTQGNSVIATNGLIQEDLLKACDHGVGSSDHM